MKTLIKNSETAILLFGGYMLILSIFELIGR